jgi:hypothetical protein
VTGAVASTDRDLRRTFVLVVGAVVAAFVLIGGLLAAFGTGQHRPEGVAERWLVAVGDTTRKGVRDRSREEAEKVGPLALANDLLPDEDTDGKAAFVDLEVGKAVDAGEDVRHVPFRLHQRQADGVGPAVEGTVVLTRRGEDWAVSALDPPVAGRTVPSEGGAPAADAPWGLYLGAFGLAVVLTAGCVVLLRIAGRPV